MPTRVEFHHQLEHLRDQLLDMGLAVRAALEKSITALRGLDPELAQRIIAEDRDINQTRFRIEERCLDLIATQAPLARDLRTIVAVMHIIVDLERMADHAEGTAEIVLLHQGQPLLKRLIDLPRMAEIIDQMLGEALQAFVRGDAERAREIALRDDEVDALHDQVYRELLTYMIQDPQTITRATWLMWVSHNLERMADHVTNICERTIYLVTGEMEEINVRDREM